MASPGQVEALGRDTPVRVARTQISDRSVHEAAPILTLPMGLASPPPCLYDTLRGYGSAKAR